MMATPLTAATSGTAKGVQMNPAAGNCDQMANDLACPRQQRRAGIPARPARHQPAAGEATSRHIQGYVNTSSSYRRCVANTEPLWSPP